MSDFLGQLAEYRKQRSWEYHREERLANIKIKYSKLLVLDPVVRAGYRIAGFFGRLPRFTYCCINQDNTAFCLEVPGRFRYRTIWNGALYMYDLREIGPFCTERKDRVEEIMVLYPPLEPHKIKSIVRQWFRVNPTTNTGLKFQQDMNYQKSLIKDWIRTGKI